MSDRLRALACKALAIVVAVAGMGHVGSADTFFAGEAGPYRIRVSVRLPGVIPGRAEFSVRVVGADPAAPYTVSVRAAQWNLGLDGAPPAEVAAVVPGDPELRAGELWFMTATSYRLFVTIAGRRGEGTAIVPMMALATRSDPMGWGLGALLGGLGIFLAAGLLTLIGAAVRESGLAPGVSPDRIRRQRARLAMAITLLVVSGALWGGRAWWSAEASAYRRLVLYQPFATETSIDTGSQGERRLTLGIRDPRWDGAPNPLSRYNALLPDHGKLMHLFLVSEPAPEVIAHLHPVPRTPAALDFEGPLPALPPGRYRVFADIVHESGYAQTLVDAVDVGPGAAIVGGGDPDDSWFSGEPIDAAQRAPFKTTGGLSVDWRRSEEPLVEGVERLLEFAVADGDGQPLSLEPYMGMIGHVAVMREDGGVFAHLHPGGTVSMAALQRDRQRSAPADGHAAHATHPAVETPQLSIPYAFPSAGRYRIWVQVKHEGRVETAAFAAEVQPR